MPPPLSRRTTTSSRPALATPSTAVMARRKPSVSLALMSPSKSSTNTRVLTSSSAVSAVSLLAPFALALPFRLCARPCPFFTQLGKRFAIMVCHQSRFDALTQFAVGVIEFANAQFTVFVFTAFLALGSGDNQGNNHHHSQHQGNGFSEEKTIVCKEFQRVSPVSSDKRTSVTQSSSGDNPGIN